jgi:putative DNA methylase
LSSKNGKEAYVQPVVEGDKYQFNVRLGRPPADAKNGTKLARGANFRCLLSGVAIEPDYIKSEAMAGHMKAKLMAIVAEGERGRVYLSPVVEHEAVAHSATPGVSPSAIHVPIANDPRALWCLLYGLDHFDMLFTPRQLLGPTTFSDLVADVRERIVRDAVVGGMLDDDVGLDTCGTGAKAYAEAVSVYLAFIVDKLSESHCSICTWSNSPKNELVVSTFRRQGIPMTWDFAEANPFAESSGSIAKVSEAEMRVLPVSLAAKPSGKSLQIAAQAASGFPEMVVSIDPPYYSNIGYADLYEFLRLAAAITSRSFSELARDDFCTED